MAPAEEKFTQDGRILNLQTPLGKDVLLIDSIDATEAISSLYKYEIRARHHTKPGPPHVIKPQDILGKAVMVELVQRDGTTRHFHGIVNRFTQGGRDELFTSYAMEVVPQLWLLTRTMQSRIFQNKNVKDILKKVLNGIPFEDRTQRTYEPKNYCVQYRESDFDFASRIMEEEGIFYYFKHTPDAHTLIIADTPVSHDPCPSKSSIDFVLENTGELETPVVYEWALDYQLQAGKIEFWDDKFQLPGKKLEAPKSSRFNDLTNGEIEFYDYPGGYAKRFDRVDKGGGDQEANLQKVFTDSKQVVQSAVDALDAKHKTYRGLSDCASFTAGHKVKIDKFLTKDDNREYALTSLTLHCDQSPDYTSVYDELDSPIQNQFECIPLGDATFPPFRPQHVTPKPTVYGPITAVVVGPAGDEIYTDKYGRVKVQFHWDREGKNDAGSSCWIRVCTSIAGNKWGTMFIPRVGQEVMVAFEHGDPDQPLIIGSVYNEKSMPHYELPKYETLSYFKTRTSPDDGKGFNELRFEDKKGKEQVFVHSQKRYDLRVKGSMYETCGGNRQEVIGYKVIVDGKEQSGGNLATTVGGNFDLHVGGDQFIGIDKGLYETVKSDVGEEYKSKHCSKITAARELNARSITLEALSSITLKVGSSFIVVNLTGITIQGPMVNINSGGAATPTSPFQMSGPFDAEHADTGEPGYLDRPRPSGGGGGSRWRTVDGYHAPNVTRNDDGSYQVQSVVVRGTPEYQQAVLTDLAQMSNTTQGQALLDRLEGTGQTTTITEQTPAPNPPNAFAGPGNSTDADFQNATPAGQPVFDGAGQPINDASGNQLLGTGTGGPSNVGYNPDQWPDPTSDHNAPGDVILFHELQHSEHQQNGTFDGTPRSDGFTTNEEFNTIGPENQYRDERGVERRTNHGDL